ncbi:MAG: hypothetical protein Q4E26_03590, partial [Prevotellaceae bacterium]|nr:hypothetical protein [Prevotellaceae bacterium]
NHYFSTKLKKNHKNNKNPSKFFGSFWRASWRLACLKAFVSLLGFQSFPQSIHHPLRGLNLSAINHPLRGKTLNQGNLTKKYFL